jgi:hypothetical protein
MTNIHFVIREHATETTMKLQPHKANIFWPEVYLGLCTAVLLRAARRGKLMQGLETELTVMVLVGFSHPILSL